MISWETIDFKGKSNANGDISVLCPLCSHTRKPANQKSPCLYINPEKGIGKCKNCQEVAIKNQKSEEKTYTAPPVGWENHTTISDNLVKWFKNERGISQTTLLDCKITEEIYWQPGHNKKVNNIVFNYFEGSTLRNKKYRSQAKKFTQCKDAKKIFYGINDIIGESSCYIVEGEMDKLAFWEIGVKNVISVPNGANDLNNIFDTCAKYLEGMEKIFIAVDNDEAGQKLENELIKRFGKWRCEKIEFQHGKDAGDELKHSPLSLQEAIDKPKKYPVDGVYGAKDLRDEILKSKSDPKESTIKPINPAFSEFNNAFSILPGQLTVVTGTPSMGKSTFIEWYVLNLINDLDLKASFYSPEQFPMAEHFTSFAEKTIGKPFKHDYYGVGEMVPAMSETEIDEFIEWSHDKLKLIAKNDGKIVDWSWLFDKFKESMMAYGSDILVIDAWNKVRRKNPESLGEINEVLADLTAFAQSYNIHIFLIAHPTKMRKNDDGTYQIPGLYDVKGSGDFRDQTANGLVVHQHFAETSADGTNYVEVINLKTKKKIQGRIGTVTQFDFDLPSERYYPRGTKPNRDCLFKPTTETKPSAMIGNPDEWIESSGGESLEPINDF